MCLKNAHTARYGTEVKLAVVFRKSDPQYIFSPTKQERGNVLPDRPQTSQSLRDILEAIGDCVYRVRMTAEIQSPRYRFLQEKHVQLQSKYHTQTSG